MNTYLYEDIQLGHTESFHVTLTSDMVRAFGELTGDVNPLHVDAAYARAQGYDDTVVYGMLTASFLSTLAGMYLPGKYSLIHSVEVKFPKPIYVTGEKLTVTGTVTEKNELFHLLTIKVSIENDAKEKVCRAIMKVGLLNVEGK